MKTKFRRQHPVDIFIVDFYCHEYKLVIEVDGESHNDQVKTEYDLNRTAELNKFGIRVIRFTNEEVILNANLVIMQIQNTLRESAPLQGGLGGKKNKKQAELVGVRNQKMDRNVW